MNLKCPKDCAHFIRNSTFSSPQYLALATCIIDGMRVLPSHAFILRWALKCTGSVVPNCGITITNRRAGVQIHKPIIYRTTRRLRFAPTQHECNKRTK